MIIKSHVRGGHRAAAAYLKDQGLNENIRLVEISDPDAKNLDEAFGNMWAIGSHTRCKKPLHHISINPMKDERLSDAQVMAIVERCEQKYGYRMFHHQRVIVEHIKDGRQHFHVIWNRVSLYTGGPVWPGHHWNKSRQVAREMETELGLKRPKPRSKICRGKAPARAKQTGRKNTARYQSLKTPSVPKPRLGAAHVPTPHWHPKPSALVPVRGKHRPDQNHPAKLRFRRPEWEAAALIAWALENGRLDVLAQFGIYLTPESFEP